MSRSQPHLRQLRRQAKLLLEACQASDSDAIRRMRRFAGRLAKCSDQEASAQVVLRDAQHVVARESGFATWDELISACEDLLGMDRQTLEEALLDQFPNASVKSLRVLQAGDLGGLSGCKKVVIALQTGSPPGELRILLKRLLPRYAFEAEVYAALQALGAPLASFYGTVQDEDGTPTMLLEYLPVTVDWPIPTDYHLSWAESAARLAASPVSSELRIPRKHWVNRRADLEHDLGMAMSLEDPVLQDELARRRLAERIEAIASRLPKLLAAGDRLPTAFCHGSMAPLHTGRREAGREVLFFDLGSSYYGPRFMDFADVTIDHGEPYEADLDAVIDRLLTTYGREAGVAIPREAFLSELRLCRGLKSLDILGITLDWFARLKRTDEDSGEFFTSPRKWIVLHLEALIDAATAS